MFLLDVGQDRGALVLYAPSDLKDEEVEISFVDGEATPKKVHTGVVARKVNGRMVCAAVFPSLKAGEYTFWRPAPPPQPGFQITAGQVVELDWR